jgi:hypothetical protein
VHRLSGAAVSARRYRAGAPRVSVRRGLPRHGTGRPMNDGEPEPLKISTDLHVSEGVAVMSAEFIRFDT